MIDEIEDHRVLDEAVPKSMGTFQTRSGGKRKRRTTAGWEILVRWKDGSSDWVKLKDLKDSYPVQLADYAVNNKIQDEPAFAWWVPFVLKKRIAIISKIKTKYWQKTQSNLCKLGDKRTNRLRHLWRDFLGNRSQAFVPRWP